MHYFMKPIWMKSSTENNSIISSQDHEVPARPEKILALSDLFGKRKRERDKRGDEDEGCATTARKRDPSVTSAFVARSTRPEGNVISM